MANPSSLVTPKPGEVRNPAGRKGKNGLGGFSLKTSFKKYIETLPPEAIAAIWTGLLFKAQEGDYKTIEFMTKLNDEILGADKKEVGDANGPQIIINMPKKDEESC